MSPTSSSSGTPPRRREPQSHWGYEPYEHTPPHPYGYQGNPPATSHSRGPSGYYSPTPPHYPPRNDYYGYEPSPRGSWGLSHSFDSYSHPPSDRSMPPPSRGPHRGAIRQSLSHEESPLTPIISRLPPSPSRSTQGPPPLLQPKRNDFLPPTPPRKVHERDDKVDLKRSDSNEPKKKKDSDPLSVLANVSAGINDKDQAKKELQDLRHVEESSDKDERRIIIPMPAPTSPLQRRSKVSPITPNTTSPGDKKAPRHAVTPARSLSHTSSWEYGHEYGIESPPRPVIYAPRRRYPGYHDYPQGLPALVEQRSFESQGSYISDRAPYGAPPPAPYHYDEQPYGGYWEGPPTPYPSRYGYEQHQWGGYPERYDMPVEDPYYRGPPPPPSAPLHYRSPYTTVQQPRLEEKSILRKKFSWKHYPEVRFDSIYVCFSFHVFKYSGSHFQLSDFISWNDS